MLTECLFDSTFCSLKRLSLPKIFHRPKENNVKTLYMKFYCLTLHNNQDIDVIEINTGKEVIVKISKIEDGFCKNQERFYSITDIRQ